MSDEANKGAPLDPEAVFEATEEQSEQTLKLTAEQKRRERLLANLEKGRKTALENRKRRALHKRLQAEEANNQMGREIKEKLLQKQSASEALESVAKLKAEIDQLKAEKAVVKVADDSKAKADVVDDPKAKADVVDDVPPAKVADSPAIEEPVVISTFRPAPW